MEVSMKALAALLFWSFGIGAALGVLYDLFRITRVMLGVSYSQKISERLESIDFPFIGKKKKPPPVAEKAAGIITGGVIFAEDVAFFTVAAVSLEIAIFALNNGKFRLFPVIAAAVGFSAYYFTVGKAVMYVSAYIAFFVSVFFRYIIFFVFTPILWLYNSLKSIIIKTVKNAYGIYRVTVTAKSLEHRLLDGSRCGFIE